jgi:hypothetical protein
MGINSAFKGLKQEDVDFVHLDQFVENRQVLVNTIMSLWVPQNMGYCLASG